jgi:hypothetical protein
MAMVVELGFTARIKAQLQIEKAQSLQDLAGVVELLCKHLRSTPPEPRRRAPQRRSPKHATIALLRTPVARNLSVSLGTKQASYKSLPASHP